MYAFGRRVACMCIQTEYTLLDATLCLLIAHEHMPGLTPVPLVSMQQLRMVDLTFDAVTKGRTAKSSRSCERYCERSSSTTTRIPTRIVRLSQGDQQVNTGKK